MGKNLGVKGAIWGAQLEKDPSCSPGAAGGGYLCSAARGSLEGLRCIYQQELQKAMGQWTTCTDQGFQVDRRRFFGKPSFYLASKFLSNTKETLMRLEEKSFVLRVA